METILEQMIADGYTSDSQKDQVIRLLAKLEDGLEDDEEKDLLAEVRHDYMFGHNEVSPQ